MATIDIPDSMVPEGYEIGETKRATRLNGAIEDQLCVTVYLRRKPRLKRIVFTVAGEATKQIQKGNWYLNKIGEPTLRSSNGDLLKPLAPLIRTEEFE